MDRTSCKRSVESTVGAFYILGGRGSCKRIRSWNFLMSNQAMAGVIECTLLHGRIEKVSFPELSMFILFTWGGGEGGTFIHGPVLFCLILSFPRVQLLIFSCNSARNFGANVYFHFYFQFCFTQLAWSCELQLLLSTHLKISLANFDYHSSQRHKNKLAEWRHLKYNIFNKSELCLLSKYIMWEILLIT